MAEPTPNPRRSVELTQLDDVLQSLRSQDISSVSEPRCQREAIAVLDTIRALESEALRRLHRSEAASISAVAGFLTVDRMIEHHTDSPRSRLWGRVVEWCLQHPETNAALHSGRLSADHVDVLARHAFDLVDAYRTNEQLLIDLAAGRTLEGFTMAVRHWRDRVAPAAVKADTQRVFENRGLWMQHDFEGGAKGRFKLDPIGAEAVATMLETNPDPTNSPIPPRSAAQRRADELVDVANRVNDSGEAGEPREDRHGADDAKGADSVNGAADRDFETPLEPTGARTRRVAVNVTMDLRTTMGLEPSDLGSIRSELGRSGHVPPHVARQLLCDASFRRVIFDGSNQVLNTGDSRAEIPTALRRSVQIRDRHCQFTGCNRAWHACHLHHLVPREHGGITSERNLVLLCTRHHTMVHQADYGIARDPVSGDVITRLPDYESDDWGLDHRGKWVKHPPPADDTTAPTHMTASSSTRNTDSG